MISRIRTPQASSAPTSLRTSNHSQESLFREDVLRRIFRLLWLDASCEYEIPSLSMNVLTTNISNEHTTAYKHVHLLSVLIPLITVNQVLLIITYK